IVSPCHEGESLSRLLVRRGRFPVDVVHKLAYELARQLSATGTLPHGDLRPSNVLLTSRGEVVLLNWGILNAMVPVISLHRRLPLEAWDGFAPERLEAGRPASTTADMYALGCLLWQLLTGRVPYGMVEP